METALEITKYFSMGTFIYVVVFILYMVWLLHKEEK